MTQHDTWRDVDVHCEVCGMHAEDPGHTTAVCRLGYRVRTPQSTERAQPYRDSRQLHDLKHRRRSTFWRWCAYCQQEAKDALPAARVDGRSFHRDGSDPTTWCAEASTLGLAPGQWPQLLVAAMPPHGMEPAMDEEFFRLDTETFDGQLAAVVYATRLRTAYLKVFND